MFIYISLDLTTDEVSWSGFSLLFLDKGHCSMESKWEEEQ